MNKYVPRECGKCGSRRAPNAQKCKHCGRIFDTYEIRRAK